MSEQMRRLTERDTLARLFHGFVGVATFALGMFSPHSVSASIASADGFGQAVVGAQGILGVLIMADTYINDVQPPHLQLRWTSRYRHYLHILLALANVAASYSQALQDRSGPIELAANAFWFLGAASFGAWIAWRDGRRRQGHALWGT